MHLTSRVLIFAINSLMRSVLKRWKKSRLTLLARSLLTRLKNEKILVPFFNADSFRGLYVTINAEKMNKNHRTVLEFVAEVPTIISGLFELLSKTRVLLAHPLDRVNETNGGNMRKSRIHLMKNDLYGSIRIFVFILTPRPARFFFSQTSSNPFWIIFLSIKKSTARQKLKQKWFVSFTFCLI